MADLLEEQRETWGSRGGFVLAAVGSAVGLGNLWGFPYKLYSYGGGAFLIPYIVALFLIGVPLMILEFSIGHYTQRAAPDAFKRGHKRFEIAGWWGIILAFVIITYYPVILAYCLSFLWYSIQGMFNGGELPWAGEGIEGVANAKRFFFDDYLGMTEGPALGSLRMNLVWPLILTWIVMYLCIFRGVKLVGKIVWLTVPLPWLMLAVLTVRGLTLEGSMQGLSYFLNPTWDELLKPTTWRYAFGQVFFSLSLAYGVMITYASFLHRKSDLNNNAAIISLADFATSFIAGLAVFATLGGMAYVTQQSGNLVPVQEVAEKGPSLAFVAFPYALAQLPYSAYFSFIFFFALVTLGIDSGFSLIESILASIVDKTGWPRSIVLPLLSLVGLGVGLVYVTEGGLNWIDTIDGVVNGTWGIAFMGLLECVVLAWLWRVGILRRHANSRSDWRLGKWWDLLLRLVIPVVLGTLFFWQLFDDLAGGGLLHDVQGNLVAAKVVGMAVVIGVPVLAVVFTFTRGRSDIAQRLNPEAGLPTGGKSVGLLTFIVSVAIAAAFLIWLKVPLRESVAKVMLWTSIVAGVLTMLVSHLVLEIHNTSETQASWFARWAGMISAMGISAFVAAKLMDLTKSVAAEEQVHRIDNDLTATSYGILAAVFLIIVVGLGWCFYRAIAAAGSQTDIQHPDEVDDEDAQE